MLNSTNLLVHSVPFSKYNVTTNQAGHERVKRALLALVHLLLEKKECLVYCDEFGEVKGMLLRSPEDALSPGLPATNDGEFGSKRNRRNGFNSLSSTKENRHDKRMGEADLDTIDKPIPSALEDGEVLVVSRVRDDFVDNSHGRHLEDLMSEVDAGNANGRGRGRKRRSMVMRSARRHQNHMGSTR